MPVSVLHAADLHLDSPLLGLERYPGAPVSEVRSATRRAFEALIQLCLDEDVKLLLLAGDLYDGDWRDYSTGLFFAAQLARLRELGTEVVWIRGNHDAQSKITRHLELGPHCVELSVRRPETRVLAALGIAVHGQGFATPAVSEDLAARYPEPIAGLCNIGLLHTALSGRRGHASYAPSDLRTLSARGYDYWALGHVHQREIVQRDPWVVFPGNLQARHVREGGAKGAILIRVADGAIERVEPRELDVVRFAQLEIDAAEAHGAADVAELCTQALERALGESDGRLLCARLHVRGRSQAHLELAREPERATAQILSQAEQLARGDVWIESVRFATEAAFELAALSERDDALGHLLRSLASSELAPEAQSELCAELAELERTLPHELREELFARAADDSEAARELIASARPSPDPAWGW